MTPYNKGHESKPASRLQIPASPQPMSRLFFQTALRPRRLILSAGIAASGLIIAAAVWGLAPTERRADAAVTPGDTAAAATAVFQQKIVPLVAKYCGDCHGGATPEAKLDLIKYHAAAEVLRDRRIWRTALNKITAHEMPPEDQEQPSNADRAQLTGWIKAALDRPVPISEQDPGQVTIRRLNRAEYNNTIRDLTGVDFHPADDFPTDDVGYGFDNIGDVLSLSPILVEKYLRASQRIIEQALTIPPPPTPTRTRFLAEQMRASGEAEKVGRGRRRMLSNGDLSTNWNVPQRGDYTIRIRAYGEKAGKDAPHMEFKVDGKVLRSFDVTNEIGSQKTYDLQTKLDAGEHHLAVSFTNAFTDDNSKKRRRALVLRLIEAEESPDSVPAQPLPESYRRLMIERPESEHPSADERADTARKILRHFANRAFRRPVQHDELDRLMKLWERVDKDDVPLDRSLQVPLEAVLVSPHFLFRAEPDPEPNNPQPHRIDDFALASRLAYFLWSSMPDEELFAVAGRGELHSDAQLEAQIHRMLRDPKSKALVDNFAAQWLQFRRIDSITPDKDHFPQFNDELRSAMRREAELFFEHVVHDDRSVLDFVDSDYTFVNERLAKLYGIPNVSGDEFRQVSTKGSHRGGVLTQAAILLITSNPARTSPVKRGKWVMENVLGTPPAPPPPNVPALKDDQHVPLTGTLRERMVAHRANAICASCHKSMDPLGFGLENFDAIGQWRTEDGKFPVDAAGTLPGGREFKGVDGLKQILLAQREQFAHCLAEKMLTYALGRGLEDSDAAAVDQIAGAAIRSDYRFSSFVIEIARSAPFQWRRGNK